MEHSWLHSDLAAVLSSADWSEDEDLYQLLHGLEDDSSSTHAQVDTEPFQQQQQGVTPPLPSRKNAKRQHKVSGSTRVRTELLQLRTKARDLEEQIALMRKRFSSKHTAPSGTAPASPPEKVIEPRRSIWKSVAQRQYRAMREAQKVNERLRTAVEEERKAMQAFIRSLGRGNAVRSTDADTETVLHPMRKRGHVVDYDQGVDVFQCQQLLQQLDTMILSLDDAVSHACFHSKSATSRVSLPDDDGGVSVLDCRVLPFARRAVADCIWDYYAARDTVPAPFPHMAFVSSDVMVKGFKIEHGIPALHISSCVGVVVGRRVVEAHRSIMVWTAIVTPCVVMGSLFPSLEKIALHVSGWEVVEQVHHAGAAPMAKVSMHHTVRMGEPSSPNAKRRRNVVSDALRKLMAKGMRDHQDAVYRSIDDALMLGQPISRTQQAGPTAAQEVVASY